MEPALATFFLFMWRSVGFYQGDIKLLTDDIATLRPTYFPMVPRIMNKMYDRVSIQEWKLVLFNGKHCSWSITTLCFPSCNISHDQLSRMLAQLNYSTIESSVKVSLVSLLWTFGKLFHLRLLLFLVAVKFARSSFFINVVLFLKWYYWNIISLIASIRKNLSLSFNEEKREFK